MLLAIAVLGIVVCPTLAEVLSHFAKKKHDPNHIYWGLATALYGPAIISVFLIFFNFGELIKEIHELQKIL